MSLLKLISSSKISCIDLIVATDKQPIVLCTGQESNILNYNSLIWQALISLLYENEKSIKKEEKNKNFCNLKDAINLTIKLKTHYGAKKYMCFVLTDGCFDKDKKEDLRNIISYCEELQMNIYGIGLGLYPVGIKEIFSKCLWSPDLKYFFSGLESIIKNENNFPSDFIWKLGDDDAANILNELTETIENISEKRYNLCKNKNLYKYLEEYTVHIESFNETMNIDQFYDKSLAIKPIDSNNNSMFKKGFFGNLKILICCFWGKSIAGKNERDEIDPKYLKERFNNNKNCLADVIGYYGIKNNNINVISNYEEAIKEMSSGKYYATWIICGYGKGNLPNGGNSNLVGQFITCSIRYWKRGGALVWWCDNEPLVYELNLFLEESKTEFPGENMNSFQFGGNHLGTTVMVAGDIQKNPIQRFNNQRYFKLGNIGESQKKAKFLVPSLGHSLLKIAIGTTVSFAQNKNNRESIKSLEDLKPYIPFAYDEKGCISILFYISPLNSKRGNIVIDGGFSKLFTELDTEGTSKYIQNIIGFTSSYHKRFDLFGENWMDKFSLESFDPEINYKEKWEGFIYKSFTKEYNIVYMIDGIGSMQNWIEAAGDRCLKISEDLKNQFPDLDFRFGGIFYRDPIDKPTDIHEIFDLTNDYEDLKNKFSNVKADGGGDDPEDWVGAYSSALNLNWRDGTKLIIHIADAAAHTKEFCGEINHEEEAGKLQKILKSVADKNIKIFSFAINQSAKSSFQVCESYYSKYKGFFKTFSFDNIKSDTISDQFEEISLAAAVCAAPKDIDYE